MNERIGDIINEALKHRYGIQKTIKYKDDCPCCNFKHELKKLNIPYKVVGQELNFAGSIIRFIKE